MIRKAAQAQIRNPKNEIRNKLEIQSSKSKMARTRAF
jgi:hypothetical protein